MFDILTTIITNFFRTFIIKKFISIFFKTDEVKHKNRGKYVYILFFIVTTAVHLIFRLPMINIVINILMIYTITQIYEGEQKKKILATISIYGINMACDILSVYSFTNYIVGENYNEISAYITVLLICICENYLEKYIIKKKGIEYTPPYWHILIFIPAISIVILLYLLLNNLKNQGVLIIVSAGILIINMLIFYLYNALLDAYIRLEENSLFERQLASYTNQLDILMQSEEKLSALRHDMKHHLNELLLLASGNQSKNEIVDYIQNMRMFIENKKEYTNSGNKEIDSILNYMLNEAQKILDEVEYKISIPKDISIRFFDLNIIFGNLLDNAILAASNSRRKWLSVFVHYDKGLLFINIKNSYEGRLSKWEDSYLSTKRDTGRHGIGLQNVKRVIKNYNGSINISDDNNIFDIKVVLYTMKMK